MSSLKKDKRRKNKYGKFCPYCYSVKTVHLPLGEATATLMKYLPLDEVTTMVDEANPIFGNLNERTPSLLKSNLYACTSCKEIFEVVALKK